MDSMMAQFGMRTIKMDFEHEAFRGKDAIASEVAKTRLALGKAMSQERDSKGVKVSWKLNPTWKKFNEKGDVTMTFKELWTNVEEGYYDAFSIAYVPTRTQTIERDGKSIRLLDDLNLLNVALTGNAINPAASMTSVMAKSLDFMKNQENKDNDPGDLSLLEVKSKIDKLTNELSELKTHMGCNQMTDKTESELKAEAEAKAKIEAEEKSKVEAEAKAKVDAEEKAKADAEAKSKLDVDIKSRVEKLEADVKSVQKENAEIKAILEKARPKGLGAEDKEIKGQGNDVSMIGPLDLV